MFDSRVAESPLKQATIINFGSGEATLDHPRGGLATHKNGFWTTQFFVSFLEFKYKFVAPPSIRVIFESPNFFVSFLEFKYKLLILLFFQTYSHF